MRRLGRKTLYTNDNSLEVRVEQLERRFATPELEYVIAPLTGPSTVAPGATEQLTMTDDEYPFGQYGSALNPPVGPILYGYSLIDDYIQCNSFGKDGFWHLGASVDVDINDTVSYDTNVWLAQLLIGMETWDEDDVFVSTINSFWSFRGVDNRTIYVGAETVSLKSQAMFFVGSVFAGQRARFKVSLLNGSATSYDVGAYTFWLIRYGNAIGTVTSAG